MLKVRAFVDETDAWIKDSHHTHIMSDEVQELKKLVAELHKKVERLSGGRIQTSDWLDPATLTDSRCR
jgi:hypothetical protein